MEVISRETIMPSSPTPNDNKTLPFSRVDQLLPEIYIPFIFFYQADESTGLTTVNHPKISLHLKHSLSRCLPSFYPFAGRVTDNHSVLCNDAGVDFVEARAHARLTDVVQDSDMAGLKQYFPLDPSSTFGHGASAPLALVQLTLFECGGVALGACVSHKVADFASAIEFFRAWSKECRGVPEASELSFCTSRYFPPNFILSHLRLSSYFVMEQNLNLKRFVFDREKLALLRRAATSPSPDSVVTDPTRVELVSGFIWKQFTETAKSRGRKTASYAFHAVNLRRRMDHLRNVLGNCSMFTTASARCGDRFPGMIGELRRSIRKVRDEYVMKPFRRSSALVDGVTACLQIMMGRADWVMFSSWRGFEVYGVDFGWGRPVWFSGGALPCNNLVVLMDSRSGDDVEAIVTADLDVIKQIESQIGLICGGNV